MPLLLALLLSMLQVVTLPAHALLHAAAAHTVSTSRGHPAKAAFNGTEGDEKPCALCAADHLPALPETRSTATVLVAVRTEIVAPSLSPRSSAPLEVFCRPPPQA